MVPAMETRPAHSGLCSTFRQHALVPRTSRSTGGPCRRRTAGGEAGNKPISVPSATRDIKSKYQLDFQTNLKPGDFADREDNKMSHVAAAADWQTVIKLFYELGTNTDRNIGLVGDMLVSLQRLVPAAAAAGSAAGGSSSRLGPEEANLLATGITNICSLLINNITRVNNKLLINVIWALALLPDPAKTLKTAAATAARARCVGVFGAAVLNRISKYTAEEVFHVGAGLAMLGFKPPRTLQADSPPEGSSRAESTTFGALIERRSIKVMHYLSPKAIADAGFVAARLVAPGDMSAEWLKLFAYVSKQQLATMQPEGVIYAGYALARHKFRPSNTWRKRYMEAIQESAKTLAGEEFPMVLYTLAKWQQQQQPAADEDDDDLDPLQQQQWSSSSSSSGAFVTSSSGPVPSQALIGDLLLASHTNRALRQLPLNQLVVMLKALAEIGCNVNPLWLQRVWPVVNAQIDAAAENAAAASSSVAWSSNLAALITAIPALKPRPDLPADFLDIVVGNLGLGLGALVEKNPREVLAVQGALQQLGYTPDQIFVRQLQEAIVQGLPAVASKDIDALLQLGLTAAAGSSDDGSVQGYYQLLLEGLVAEVEFRLGLVSDAALMSAAAAAAAAGVDATTQRQQQPGQRQQLLASAASSGLWQLPQSILACIDHVTAASAAAAGSSGSSVQTLDRFLPQLQELWRASAVYLATAMPIEPLLILLNNMLDLEDNEQQQQQLGLTDPDTRRAVTSDILQAGIYDHIATSSSTAAKGRKAAAASSSSSSSSKDLLRDLSVADWQELLVIVADAGLAESAPGELLTLAAEGLHKALTDLPKPRSVTQDMTDEDILAHESDLVVISNFFTQQYIDDLVIVLKQDFGFSLPAKVKSKYKAMKQVIGQDLPVEITQRAGGRKKASNSSSKKSSGSNSTSKAGSKRDPSLAAATATADDHHVANHDVANSRDSDVLEPPEESPLGAAADQVVRPPQELAAAPVAAAPVSSVDGITNDRIVRSSRSRSSLPTGM